MLVAVLVGEAAQVQVVFREPPGHLVGRHVLFKYLVAATALPLTDAEIQGAGSTFALRVPIPAPWAAICQVFALIASTRTVTTATRS